MDNELCVQADISDVTRNTNVKIHQAATLVACAETCAVQNIICWLLPISSSSGVAFECILALLCLAMIKLQDVSMYTTFKFRSLKLTL